MAHFPSLQHYLVQVDGALKQQDGHSLADFVSLEHYHVQNPNLQVNFESQCQVYLDSPFDEMFAAHIRCAQDIGNGNLHNAFACQMVVVQSFLKAFQAQKEENWALPVLNQVILDLRLLGIKAEAHPVSGNQRKEGELLERAAEQMMSCFRMCVSDTRVSREDSKRWGTLAIVNQLFKIYFKINKLHLCKPLIRAIESSDLKNDFSISHRVTYKYFVGRKAMFDSEFKSAVESLEFSFNHCLAASQRNKRLILVYLIPVKMLMGQVPSPVLLEKYGLHQFTDVAQAVCSGNLLRFTESLERHQAFFIRTGIYFILEKLKTVVLRNLFKKVWLLQATHQLSLQSFEAAMLFNKEEEVDLDEVECILANLIDKGYIKGYISHQHQKLVVSKANAFPPLAQMFK